MGLPLALNRWLWSATAAAAGTAILNVPAVTTAASAAWGMRRLVAGYTGPLFRVVRSSDSTTFTVNQLSDGTPDTTGFATFAGSTTTKIDLVYDQVGSNNLTQTTSANRPAFYLADTVRGKYGASIDNQNFAIPSGLTGDGRATTSVHVASNESSNAGSGFSQLGAAYNGAGSRCIQLGAIGKPLVTLLNSAFVDTTLAAKSNPSVITTVQGASNDIVRVDGVSSTVAQGSAGTWTGGFIGRNSVPNTFIGQWFGTIIYPAALSSGDCATVEAALSTMFDIVAPDSQIIMPGNSIVQGTSSVRSIWNNPRQAEPYITPRCAIVNAGVFGQTAATAYTNRAQITARRRADLRKNIAVCPEPSNDIDALTVGAANPLILTFTGNCASGVNTITSASSTTGLAAGQYLFSSGFFPAGTTIVSIAGNTVTLSANALGPSSGLTFTARAPILSVTATTSSTINPSVLTSVSSFAGLAVGQILSGTGIPTRTTITALNSGAGTITMSANATASATVTVVVIDQTATAAVAATLWSGSSGVRAYFSAMTTASFVAADCLVPTTLPRNWTTGAGGLFDQKEAVRLAYNALIASDQGTYGYTVLNYAGISALSNPAGSNFADGIHPNSTNFASGLEVTVNGYGYMAKLFSDTANTRLAA